MPPFHSKKDGYIYVDDLKIKVEKADGELMFRLAHNVGMGDNVQFVGMGARQGQAGRQAEYIYAIGQNDEILSMLDWVGQDRLVFGKDVFWSVQTARGWKNPVSHLTSYLVWVTVNTWHDYEDEDKKVIDRTMEITVYGPPKCGFEKLDSESRFDDHFWLSTRTLTAGLLHQNHDAIAIQGRLAELAQLFYDSVYTQGMEDTLEKAEWKGCSGQFDDIQVQAVYSMRRVGVCLTDANATIELHTLDGSKDMYMGSYNGTLPQIRHLVMAAVKAWETEEVKASFGRDEEVISFFQALQQK